MSYNGMQKYMSDPIEWLRQTEPIVNGIMQGRTNNYGTVTLSANAASTTVTETRGRIGSNAVILFMPTTANAAAEIGNGTMYVPTATILPLGADDSGNNPTFVIQHANNAQTDRTFRYIIVG